MACVCPLAIEVFKVEPLNIKLKIGNRSGEGYDMQTKDRDFTKSRIFQEDQNEERFTPSERTQRS